ncbi:translation initiation factor IF-1 [Candidatus Gracilibacteria bacterium]|nr:translation initiation factor IF-1 [Candidatus Gracilibacteria bacterium]MCF7819374.1 translation initiation factor IF-1 [Candidatus Gracilibacteria bacterium]
MSNSDLIEVEGVIKVAHPGSEFQVELTTEGFEGHSVRARLSGKMRMHYIRIVPGDKVKLELSPYNLEEGRITFRYK